MPARSRRRATTVAATAALLALLAGPTARAQGVGALPQVPAALAAASVTPPRTAGISAAGMGAPIVPGSISPPGVVPGSAAAAGGAGAGLAGAGAGAAASPGEAGGAPATNEVVDQDMSPVCQATLPQCRAECASKAGTVMLYQCSAGNGLNGGPAINCQCVLPGKAAGGDQAAILQLVDQPGGRACNSKTWINDCAAQLRAQVTGFNVVLTPSIGDFMGQRCQTLSGIVLGPNQVALSMSTQYPIGISTSAPDGTVQIQFAQTGDERYANCYATYRVAQGTFLNGLAAAPAGRRGAVDPATMAAAAAAVPDPAAAGGEEPGAGGKKKSLSLGGGEASGAGAGAAARPAAAAAAAAVGLLVAMAAL